MKAWISQLIRKQRRFAREDKVKEYNLGKCAMELERPLLRKTDGFAGANTLLSYFHHCNKSVYPFSSSCRDEELRSLAQLDDTGIRFVKYTRGYVADSSKSNPESSCFTRCRADAPGRGPGGPILTL